MRKAASTTSLAMAFSVIATLLSSLAKTRRRHEGVKRSRWSRPLRTRSVRRASGFVQTALPEKWTAGAGRQCHETTPYAPDLPESMGDAVNIKDYLIDQPG